MLTRAIGFTDGAVRRDFPSVSMPRFPTIDAHTRANARLEVSRRAGTRLGLRFVRACMPAVQSPNLPEFCALFFLVGTDVGTNFRDDIRPYVRPDVGPDLGTDLRNDIRPHIRAYLGPHVWPHVRAYVRPHIRSHVWPDFGSHVGADIGADFRNALRPDLRTYFR